MDQFLAELKISGERSHFAVDWAKAQEKMGAHLDLEARDYACHFAQLAYHLGSAQIQLAVSGDWLEWSCDGSELDESKMRATAAGELLMAELDLCLNFCLQSVLLSDYVEKIFCSGGWQLQAHSSGWKLRQTQTPGTRLQLRVAWKHRVRNFLSSAWWRKLPELDRLHPRMLASPLQLITPQPLPRINLPFVLAVQGQSALSPQPPAQQVVAMEYSWLNGSFWLSFQGSECQILSQGLAFTSHPFVPGRMWLSLGQPPTDLGRRQLVLNADFQLERSHFLLQLSRHFGEWLEHPDLLGAGVREWLLGCLLTLADLEGGPFRESLAALPLLPTLCHGHLSLLELDQRVPEEGCPVCGPSSEEFEEKPFMLVAQEPRLLAFLRLRYGQAVKSGEERLESMRRWRRGPRLNLNPLHLYAHHWPLQSDGWHGAVAFDPSGTMTRLDCYRQGRLLVELGATRGLVPGFWVVADHPDLQLDSEGQFPLLTPAWQALGNWLKKWQVVWLAEVLAKTEVNDRLQIVERVLETEGLTLGPLLKVELWPVAGFTLERWLLDGQRQDLRRWVDAGIDFSDFMGYMLAKKFGDHSYHESFAWSERYAEKLQQCLAGPEESLNLPPGALVEVQDEHFPLRLGLTDQPGVRLRLYRQGRLLLEQDLDQLYGLPQGLLVAAEHDKFRLALKTSLLDLECEGYHLLLTALQKNLKPLLEAALPAARLLTLSLLEGLPRRSWPGRATLLECLDGTTVSLSEALLALEPRVLVRPAAQVLLPGFESCWRLTPADRDWLERVLKIRCLDLTVAYNEAYRVLCYENQARESEKPVEPAPAWRDPQIFSTGSLRAEAGLIGEPGPVHLCEVTFRRGGRPAMRCQLRLDPGQGREATERLVCRVEWDELPFVESYWRLLGLPEVEALRHWLAHFGFEPALECCDFQLARLEMAEPDSPLWDAPLLGSSLRQLSQPCLEIVYGDEDTLPPGVLKIPSGALPSLQKLLPQQNWRHWLQPPPDQAMKQALLGQKPRSLRLPERAYALRGERPLWIWGVAEALTGGSVVRVLYQGRPAGILEPDWDLEISAEVLVDELHLSAQGEVRLLGELELTLEAMLEDIRATLLRDLQRSTRLRLAMLWLLRERVPDWAAGLPDLRSVQEWWRLPAPRPFVFGQNTVDGALQLPPAVVGWAELQGIDLRNCTRLADALAQAEVCYPPDADFELRGPGFYLSASRSAAHTTVRQVRGRHLLEESTRHSFPPYYLELDNCPGLPAQASLRLWDWWRSQLQEPAESLAWLEAMDALLEVAEPGAEWLLAEARSRLRWLQEQNQDEWRLLRRGLEMLCSQPIRLIVGEQGPLFQIQGQTARLNRSLAGPATRPRTAALLSLAAHDRPTLYSVPRVLAMLQG